MRFLNHISTILLLPSLLAADVALSTAVRALSVEGNTAVTTREILEWMTVRPSEVFSAVALEYDLRAVRDQYRSQGYLNARIAVERLEYSSDSTLVNITLRVEEGRQSIIGALRITGSGALDTEVILEGFETT
ncbi:MAG: hypothetical protein KAJ12_02125, partial [Bacteroidetes bacterium]|nr:hypothetical protein [Bacteroidota bacterium]